eukprot:m.234220 g.234220  ORF g.234220 m.234220 type:complete len:56 (-) comp26117_c0_seq1:947-1114(-)
MAQAREQDSFSRSDNAPRAEPGCAEQWDTILENENTTLKAKGFPGSASIELQAIR